MILLIQSLISFVVIFLLLWKKNSHNVLFWGFSFQWLAVNIKVPYAYFLGIAFEDLALYPNFIVQANNYANISIIVMSSVVYLITNKIKYPTISSINWEPYRKFDKIYILYSVFFLLTAPFSYSPSFQQVFVYLILLKFSLLFITLNYNLASNKRLFSPIYLFIIFEVILSFTGYFAAFKTYFYVIFFTLIYHQSKSLRVKDYLKIVSLAALLLYIGILWSAVKMEYRSYISGGENVQANTVGNAEALKKMFELTKNMSKENIEYGLEALIDRISYLDYYSATIENVPLFEAHTNGSRLIDAMLYGLQPRILFPNKMVTDDSKATEKYTGITVNGKESATSISIGYMADGYIDFGNKFFWITPAAIALLFGISYRYLYNKAKSPIWALAITFPFFQLTSNFESDSLKIIPPIIYFTFIAILFLRFVVPIIDKKTNLTKGQN